MTKPLFLPLKAEYFEAFKDGLKHDELRQYGARWNEVTCEIGRPVTLSKGYGKAERLSGTIVGFKKTRAALLPMDQQAAILSCYGTLNIRMAVITIDIEVTE